MQISPAYASKLIKQKNEQIRLLLAQEKETATTTACADEDVGYLRVVYNFGVTQGELDSLNDEIVKLKHAINVFNTTTVLPGLGYTIDAALVRMKMLSEKKERLGAMKRVQPTTRLPSMGYGKAKPEYRYRNYEAKDVEREYRKAEKELTDIQIALDKANLESRIDVDVSDEQ